MLRDKCEVVWHNMVGQLWSVAAHWTQNLSFWTGSPHWPLTISSSRPTTPGSIKMIRDEIDAYLCGPKWFMTNRSLLFCKKCKQDPRTKSTKAKKDLTATKKTKKFCHQYQLSARRWTKWTLTPRQAVASFLLFRISLAGDVIVVMNSHLTSGIVERDWSAIKC